MALAYAYAMNYVGKPVIAVTSDGRRYMGLVHHVTPTHLILRPLPSGYLTPMKNQDDHPDILPLGGETHEQQVDVETAAFLGYPLAGVRPFAPWSGAFIALPLYVLLVLSLLWW
ncbi:MAG: hypothetical protein IMW85_08610 [Thermicanus sp.]|nr:hypothetical protein [Thermicanus sp.]